MPNLTVVFLLAGALGLGTGHAETICGDASGLNQIQTPISAGEIALFTCDTNVIDIQKHGLVAWHCIDYQTKSFTGTNNNISNYSLTGCTYNHGECAQQEYLVTTGDHYQCVQCPENRVALSGRYIIENEATAINGKIFHTKPSCDFCMAGYYFSGSECVPCPQTTTDDAYDIIANNTTSGPQVASYGDGGIETCFMHGWGRATTPTYTASDASGTYETQLKFVPIFDDEYLFCPYQ